MELSDVPAWDGRRALGRVDPDLIALHGQLLHYELQVASNGWLVIDSTPSHVSAGYMVFVRVFSRDFNIIASLNAPAAIVVPTPAVC